MIKSHDNTYIITGIKSWHRKIFAEILTNCPGNWIFYNTKEQLTSDALFALKPRYIFFLHWSWIVPDEIINNFECICFHMTDVPFGRGGSPLQNLIMRGHRQTKLTALRMVHELDAGPVYMKQHLSLEGSAEEILIRATYLSAEMIKQIIQNEPAATPQSGDVVIFKRRTPSESAIPKFESLTQLYDFIRMLDAEGYPHAFLEYNGSRYEFSRAIISDDLITAEVKITIIQGGR